MSWLLTIGIVGGMASAIGLWFLLIWRDNRLDRQRAAARQNQGPLTLCGTCDSGGWLDKHLPAANWRRCPECRGSGLVRRPRGQ